ncbi:hypothetical protein AB3R30_08395 [Leptolyngbyaceae cyanobacterium UHCC 1019]
MNYSRFIASLLTTSALASSLSIMMLQPAKADLFCYPWERNCKVDGQVGTSGNDKLGGQKWYFVNVKNNSSRAIWVAAHYRVTPTDTSGSCVQSVGADNCNSPSWATGGYWKLEPGEKALILNSENQIDNRYIYFHAHDAQGRTWGSPELKKNVRGEVQPFFKTDMGGTITNFTQSFD